MLLEGRSAPLPQSSDLSSDEALLAALDHRNLAARKAEKDAVAGRITPTPLSSRRNSSNQKCSSSL